MENYPNLRIFIFVVLSFARLLFLLIGFLIVGSIAGITTEIPYIFEGVSTIKIVGIIIVLWLGLFLFSFLAATIFDFVKLIFSPFGRLFRKDKNRKSIDENIGLKEGTIKSLLGVVPYREEEKASKSVQVFWVIFTFLSAIFFPLYFIVFLPETIREIFDRNLSVDDSDIIFHLLMIGIIVLYFRLMVNRFLRNSQSYRSA